MAAGNSTPRVVHAVLPKSAFMPGALIEVDHEQWLREQMAWNWWHQLDDAGRVFVFEMLRGEIH